MAQTVFDSPTAVGAKILTVTATVTNNSGAYTNTITDERITTAMKAIEIELGDPSVFGANITVTCNNGSITISCPDVEGTSTVSIDVIKTVDDPTSVTSIEFDVLNSRINKVKEIINDVAEYSDEATYSAGDRVWYSGKLYKANQDIDIAEDWDSTHWDQEDIMDDIDDIRDSIPDIADNLTTNDATKALSAKQGKVLNDSQTAIQDAIAIVATGDTHAAIASGQFVYVKGHSTLAEGLYRASAAIAANASLTSSNVTAESSGGLNALVVGPSSVTDGTIPLYDGTSGKAIKAGKTITDVTSSTAIANNANIPTNRTVRNGIYNGLDKTSAGFALDARQGKTLYDQVANSSDLVVSTLADVKSNLLTIAQSLSAGQSKLVRIVYTGTESLPMKINYRYMGYLKVSYSISGWFFTWDGTSYSGDDIHFAYSNGTWNVYSLASRTSFSVVNTSNTSTSIAANTSTKIEVNVAKTGKKAIAITAICPYYPNVLTIDYFRLDVSAQKAIVYIKNTSSSAQTGIDVACLYINE